jgi:UDP-N-acetylmuramate dehydrogenase
MLTLLQDHFGDRLQENVSLARYTTVRVGGPARWFAEATSAAQLADDAGFLWEKGVEYRVLGNGSNLLVSDAGWQGFVLLNQARAIRMAGSTDQPLLFCETGVALNTLVRTATEAGMSGLEWAAGIPGTVGGAVYGNAGAHGKDVSQSLLLAEILHRSKGLLSFRFDEMGFTYRSSQFKREPGNAVILSATFNLTASTREEVKAKVDAINEKRRTSQPAGPSMGSTFKNPENDKAGRLIEAAGLKGTRIGGVEISQVHGNFFVNDGSATAADYRSLIELVQKTVHDKFGVDLQLEIELFGDWKN